MEVRGVKNQWRFPYALEDLLPSPISLSCVFVCVCVCVYVCCMCAHVCRCMCVHHCTEARGQTWVCCISDAFHVLNLCVWTWARTCHTHRGLQGSIFSFAPPLPSCSRQGLCCRCQARQLARSQGLPSLPFHPEGTATTGVLTAASSFMWVLGTPVGGQTGAASASTQ